VDKVFCKCKSQSLITTDYEDSFGYWDVCCICGKCLENGYHYYNHFDGEDHEDIDYF